MKINKVVKKWMRKPKTIKTNKSIRLNKGNPVQEMSPVTATTYARGQLTDKTVTNGEITDTASRCFDEVTKNRNIYFEYKKKLSTQDRDERIHLGALQFIDTG